MGIVAIAAPLRCGAVAGAQQPKKVPLIGYLSNTMRLWVPRFEAIRLDLRELGCIEGQNIAIEYRYAEGKVDRFPELAAELVRLKVDITWCSQGTGVPRGEECDQDDSHRYGRRGTDPVEAGHVESLARPGGNVTGITTLRQ